MHMAKAPENCTVKHLVAIIDPDFKEGKYQRRKFTAASYLNIWAMTQNRDHKLDVIIYTTYQMENGSTEVGKGFVADVGERARKLYCDCGRHEWSPVIPNWTGGVKTLCQKCSEETEVVRQGDESDIDAFYDRLEREQEY